MVTTPNYFSQILFLVRHPISISVAIDGDSTGDARESGHVFECAKLMWFSFIFFIFPFYFFLGMYILVSF